MKDSKEVCPFDHLPISDCHGFNCEICALRDEPSTINGRLRKRLKKTSK
jgi:hypothetical protein